MWYYPLYIYNNFKFRMFNQQKKDKKTFCHGLSPMVWIVAMLA